MLPATNCCIENCPRAMFHGIIVALKIVPCNITLKYDEKLEPFTKRKQTTAVNIEFLKTRGEDAKKQLETISLNFPRCNPFPS